MTTPPPASAPKLRWYQGVERYCWIVLAIAALGWLFDTMDQNLFNLVRAPSTRELLVREYCARQGLAFTGGAVGLSGTIRAVRGGSLLVDAADRAGVKRPVEARPRAGSAVPLPPGQKVIVIGRDAASGQGVVEDQKSFDGRVSRTGGLLTAIFLIGWSAGGFLFGILGDRIGRTGTMVLTILIYAAFTGLSGLATTVPLYGAMRFMTALGVGGEWAAGASLVAEVFPSRSRPMALGMLQAVSALGNITAGVITLALAGLSWRWAYAVGAVPALLVLWVRSTVREPERWERAREAASTGKELGNMAELFTRPVLRRHTIAATLMAAAGVGALWGVGFFSTDLVRDELQKAGQLSKVIDQRVSIMFMLQNAGSFFGIYLFAIFAERFNRRSAFAIWFALAWVSVLLFFWTVSGSRGAAFHLAALLAPVMGFCTLGPFSGYTVYFPELFPTRLRATGCGFCYNAARILAAIAPFALGSFKAAGEYAQAATIVTSIYLLGFIGTWLGPETRGKPLPE